MVYAGSGVITALGEGGGVLDTVMLDTSSILAPSRSTKVTEHEMISLGLARLVSSCRVEKLPSVTEVLSLLHRYVGAREPSLRSDPVALHVSISVEMIVLGEILTELIVGNVFCTVAITLSDDVPPLPSDAVTEQVTVSPTATILGLRVNEAEFPRIVVPTLHSYVVVTLSLSSS